ncbi:MAG TPA: FtsX-like permease family protein [Thermodesulfovibrionales bacterium]|nr:FtsX-like permease family protein [Thermodesulfovibrionales bacterium]
MKWIEKQRNIIDFTLSSLLRRKTKNIALVFVYTVIVFVLASVVFFSHSIKKEASIILQGSPEIIVQRLSAGMHALIPEEYVSGIAKIRGVTSVTGRLWGYYYEPTARANFTLLSPEEQPGEGNIMAGEGVLRVLHASPGDILSLTSYKGEQVSLRVKGSLPTSSSLVSADLILISEGDFRNIFGFSKGLFTDLALRVRNPRERVTIAKKIKELYPDARPIIRDEILRTYDSVFNWRSGLLLMVMTGAILAFIIFAWDKATGLSAEERREIGILKAVGWETSDILLMKFWEGASMSLSSFLGGVILAYFHVFFTSSALFAPVLKGWSVLYPEFRLTPFIDVGGVMTLFFLTVLPYTVATIIPSWRAAIVDPDSVMR